jgi:hypothetical protein
MKQGHFFIRRQIRAFSAIFLSGVMLVTGGCLSDSGQAPPPKPPSENGGMFREVNEGYSLLHGLMDDESNVSKIFIIKSASEPTKGLIKEIALACDDAKKQLDQFPYKNNRIEFDVPDLPKLEKESRDLESKADEKTLLGSSGKEFELQLILTQMQAMGYAVNLCKAIESHEQDPGRQAFLNNLQKQCQDFHDRLVGMLTTK